MKNNKLLIVLLGVLLVCVAGCSQEDKSFKEVDNFKYKTVVIEGHEYIKYLTAYDAENVTHKGNCKAH